MLGKHCTTELHPQLCYEDLKNVRSWLLQTGSTNLSVIILMLGKRFSFGVPTIQSRRNEQTSPSQ
jgi:hypothetical protein